MVQYNLELGNRYRYPCPAQREGTGPLDYLAMLSLRDVAHDGVLCTFSNRSAPDRQVVWSITGQVAGIVHRVPTKSHPAGSLSSIQPVGPPDRASSLAFGLIGDVNLLLLH